MAARGAETRYRTNELIERSLRDTGGRPPEGVTWPIQVLATRNPGRVRRYTKRDMLEGGSREAARGASSDVLSYTQQRIRSKVRSDREHAEKIREASDLLGEAYVPPTTQEGPDEEDAKLERELKIAAAKAEIAERRYQDGLNNDGNATLLHQKRDKLGRRGPLTLSVIPGAVLYGTLAHFMLSHQPQVDGNTPPPDTNQSQLFTQEVTAQAQGGVTSENSRSSSYDLTQAQHAQNVRVDGKAVDPLLEKFLVRDGDKLLSVQVKGLSSPESADPQQDLTKATDGNNHLAHQRADDGKTALTHEIGILKAKGIDVGPSTVVTTWRDQTLTEGQEQFLAEVGKTHGHITPNQVVEVYSGQNKSSLGKDVINKLNQWIKRGVEYKFTFQTHHKEKQPSFVNNFDDYNPQDFLNGGFIAYAMTMAGSVASMAATFEFFVGRLAKRNAKLIKRGKRREEDFDIN